MNTFSYTSDTDFRELLDEYGHFIDLPMFDLSSSEIEHAIITLEDIIKKINLQKEKEEFDDFILKQAHKLEKLTGDYNTYLGIREFLEETASYYKEEI